MTNRNISISLVFLCTFVLSISLNAQNKTDSLSVAEATMETDTTSVKKKGFFAKIIDYFNESNDSSKSKKDFDISFIGGPSYSGDTKFGIGLVASGLYRMDNKNLNLPPSTVNLYGNFTTSGFIAVGVDGHTIFDNDKYRLDYDVFFSSMPSKYWGIGYQSGRNDTYTKYTAREFQAKFDFHRLIIPHVYFGASVTTEYIKGTSWHDKSFLNGERSGNNAIGGGYIISYDSRDFIPNPYSGLFLKYEHNFFLKTFGSTHTFNRVGLTARYYQKIWKGGILAFDMNGVFNNGATPWSMLAQLGGSRQMRGYYVGQYRDKKLIDAQVELRQKIYGRHGMVLWAGLGNAFESFKEFKMDESLPTFGIGYRWEFKERINIRLDYGIGKGESSVYFNINESF